MFCSIEDLNNFEAINIKREHCFGGLSTHLISLVGLESVEQYFKTSQILNTAGNQLRSQNYQKRQNFPNGHFALANNSKLRHPKSKKKS